MIPHERSLVADLKDKPFALIGMNSDKDKADWKKQAAENGVTWRSFWNGPDGTSGPISAKWNVHSWPTIYVLDKKGMIRFKNVRGEAMTKAVEELLAEDDKGK
jgi:Thioredoxin-like